MNEMKLYYGEKIVNNNCQGLCQEDKCNLKQEYYHMVKLKDNRYFIVLCKNHSKELDETIEKDIIDKREGLRITKEKILKNTRKIMQNGKINFIKNITSQGTRRVINIPKEKYNDWVVGKKVLVSDIDLDALTKKELINLI